MGVFLDADGAEFGDAAVDVPVKGEGGVSDLSLWRSER